MSGPFPHPETGEALESLEDFRAALRAAEGRLGPIYRLRDALSAAMAERFDPADLPRERRHRTAKQESVTHCARCGTKLEAPRDA
jgi:hypothetical protein